MTETPPHRDEVPDADHPAHVRTRPLPRHARGQRIGPVRILVAWLGAFAGIGALVLLVELFPNMQLLVIGSFGASAVLLFAAPRAPFSQPRNLVGGHLLSVSAGCTAGSGGDGRCNGDCVDDGDGHYPSTGRSDRPDRGDRSRCRTQSGLGLCVSGTGRCPVAVAGCDCQQQPVCARELP